MISCVGASVFSNPRTAASRMSSLPCGDRDYTCFAEFWPDYLRQHSRPATRVLHFVGTSLAMLVLIAACVMARWWWLLGMPVVGYGAAWLGHFVFERNRPVMLQHPLWSLQADLKMWWLMTTGRLKRELNRIGR